jgi:hypothetical protein
MAVTTTLTPDSDPRGFRGLPPFVDVVYGAVLGYGVLQIAEAILKYNKGARGNATPLYLLVVTTIYLMFHYAQNRMCTEKTGYKSLTRYGLDMFIAIAFVLAYVAAYRASRLYLLVLASLLILEECWVETLQSEHPELQLKGRLRLLRCTHFIPAGVVVLLFGFLTFSSYGDWLDRWINVIVPAAFVGYSVVLSFATAETCTDLERGLLPIIPFFGLVRRFKEFFGLHV